MNKYLKEVMAIITMLVMAEGYAYVAVMRQVKMPSGKKIIVEIADTNSARARGLMFRKELGQDRGMLFVFEQEDFHSFWMKNTLIPLDMIWISESKKIVYYVENAVPCKKDPCESYIPFQKAKYVLELKGGSSDKIGLVEGDKVLFDIFP